MAVAFRNISSLLRKVVLAANSRAIPLEHPMWYASVASYPATDPRGNDNCHYDAILPSFDLYTSHVSRKPDASFMLCRKTLPFIVLNKIVYMLQDSLNNIPGHS